MSDINVKVTAGDVEDTAGRKDTAVDVVTEGVMEVGIDTAVDCDVDMAGEVERAVTHILPEDNEGDLGCKSNYVEDANINNALARLRVGRG